MKKNNFKKYFTYAFFNLFFIFIPILVSASAFQLFAENASELGNAYAGTSASAEDTSTAYFNPAALVNFDTREVSYATVIATNSVNFTGQTLWQYTLTPLANGTTFLQNGNVHSAQTNVIPSFSEAIPLDKRYALGIAVVLPFDFSSEYGNNSVLQYATTQTDLYVVDITPNLGIALTPKWSLGFGADVDYAHLDLDYMFGLPAPIFNLPNSFDNNTESENSASGWGVGGHGGILFQPSANTRFGLSYHSPISFNLDGESKFFGPLTQIAQVAGLVSDSFHSTLLLPDYAELSAYHRLGFHWELLSSIDYVQWSLFNATFKNIQTVSPGTPTVSNLLVPIKLHDAFRVALGTNYLINNRVKLLTGIAFDQGARSSITTILLPDNPNLALATGINYQPNKFFDFAVGYSHIFNLDVNQVNTTAISGFQQVAILGNVRRSENLIGAQITWNIGYLGSG